MSKLIKKHGLGGIADAIDSSLDGLGTWGKLGVQIVDPTGVTGWKDFGNALTAFLKEGTLMKAGELGLAALGIAPMGGMFKLGKVVDKAADSAKALKKSRKLFDIDIYKKLIDPEIDISKISKEFSKEQLIEAKRIIEGEIKNVLVWAESKNIKVLPLKLLTKVDNLTKKLEIISTSNPNKASLISSGFSKEIKAVDEKLEKTTDEVQKERLLKKKEYLLQKREVFRNVHKLQLQNAANL